MFKSGDKVWSVSHGWGEVINIESESRYPIVVQFESVLGTYTEDGEQYAENNRDLFFSEIPIPPSALERPRWRAKKKIYYYTINAMGEIIGTPEWFSTVDDCLFKVGNYFQTEEEAKASKFYKVFHD